MKHPAPSAAKRRGEAVREVKWFVPLVLFSVWPFVHFANRNRDESFDAIRLIGDATVYAVAVSCLVLVVGLVFHRRRFGQIAGVAGVGTVVLFLYGVLDTMWLDFGASAPRYPLITWFILGVLALLLTWRLSRHAATVRVLTVAAAVMTGLPTVQLIFHHGWSASEPVPVLEGTARSVAKRRPNVYFFVLDMYGRHDQLQRVIGFDNTLFLRHLETKGFFVADESLANYGMTELSVPATLNMDYIVQPGDTVL